LSPDVLKKAFSTEHGVRELVRRSHPYTVEALDALPTGRVTVQHRLHEAAYYWLYVRKLRGDKPVDVINLDPHAHVFSTTAGGGTFDTHLNARIVHVATAGVNDADWAA